jgi:hypothetical protein
MAFDRSGLHCANPAAPPGSRIWTYQTLDAGTVIRVAGYFNNAARELALGDIIFYSTVTGTIKTPTGITARGTLYVNSHAAGVLDCVDAVAHATTDTD